MDYNYGGDDDNDNDDNYNNNNNVGGDNDNNILPCSLCVHGLVALIAVLS